MKKFLFLFIALAFFTGCDSKNDSEPADTVSDFFKKYQTSDSAVISDLDDTLASDASLTDDERSEYRDFFEKHYNDITYKIISTNINGDSANVETAVTVRNYASAINDANSYKSTHESEFDMNKTFAKYRLDEMKKSNDVRTYTMNFTLTKTDEKWKMDPLNSTQEDQLNGLYGVSLSVPSSDGSSLAE